LKSQSKKRIKAIEGKLNTAGKRFAIVVSRFNAFITDRLLQSAFDGLVQCGAQEKEIKIVRVRSDGLASSGRDSRTCSIAMVAPARIR